MIYKRFESGKLVAFTINGVPQSLEQIEPWRRKICTILPTAIKDDRLNVAKIRDKTIWPEPPRYTVEATGYTVKASHYSQLLSRIHEHCEANSIETPSEPAIEQWLCDNLAVKCVDENGKLYQNQYADRRNWPIILRPMRLKAQPGDKGLGDIVARNIPKGEAFKIWFKASFGFDCGCDSRQDWLNSHYPL